METTARPVLRSRVWLTATVFLVTLGLVLATTGVEQPVAVVITALAAGGVAFLVLLWALVRTGQQRRTYEDDLTAWAAERAAQAERLRIARDLHDLASHGLGLITVRAAAARTLDGPVGDAERTQALADIERTGRAATTELRRMLTVLRTPGGETAPLRPADTLDDLPRIVDAARAGGVTVTLRADDLGDVSAGAQLTACVVVREALANTARHAGPTAARVAVRRAGEAVVVIVEDDGPVPGWRPHPGAGQGLAGLRERVATLGGSLEADAAAPGFRVTARLPDRPSDVAPAVPPGNQPGNQPGDQLGKVHR